MYIVLAPNRSFVQPSPLSPFSSSLSFLSATISCKNAVPYLSFPLRRGQREVMASWKREPRPERRRRGGSGATNQSYLFLSCAVIGGGAADVGVVVAAVVAAVRLRREGGRGAFTQNGKDSRCSLFSLRLKVLSPSPSSISIDAVWFLVLFGSGFAIIRPPPGQKSTQQR